MSKASSNTGFGTRARANGARLVNKDGSFNVHKTGRKFAERFNLYHWFLNMSWPKFVLVIFTGYVIINFVFACLYMAAGFESLQGTVMRTPVQKFLSAMYFSAQTFTTVGYGRVNPVGHASNIIAGCEALIGLMGFAIMTGLIYGRFSRPRAKVMFSASAIFAPYREITGLMFRMANGRDSQMSDVSVTVIVAMNEEKDGKTIKRFYPLKLEIDKIFFFATTWTVVHPILDDSPLKGLKEADLEDRDIEILVQVSGYDDTFAQIVNDRTSYKWHEIEWNVKFKPIFTTNNQGEPMVKLEELSKTYQV
ncbi:MAG: ion channel [Flavobacteriales bacterium]|nr:ion channel [Flavobacteriales bacterium]